MQAFEETHPEAADVLREAGWTPHDVWGVYTRGPLVMGSPRAGDFHVKNVAACPDSADTPDDPVAAAHWLVARFAVETVNEPEEAPRSYDEATQEYFAQYPNEAPAHEDDAETGADAGDGEASPESVFAARAEGDAGGPDLQDGAFGEAGSVSPLLGEQDPGEEILDADFYEPAPDEGQGGAFIFGDNLHQLRTSAIGLVVQISLAKQDAIWAEAGAGPDEYSQLMSAVVRDTVDGTYRGDQATYDRFVALSTYDNAARRVQNAERERVTMLTTADRATIEGFDPQADWP